jgi:lipopolysaccharide export system protein LptA
MDVDSNKQETDKKPDQNTVYIGQIEGHQLPDETNTGRDSDIRGTSHMIGLDLTTGGLNVLGNGRQVGSKPIIIQKKLKRTNNREGAREMRIYASVERLMTLRAGKVIVSA